DALPEGAIATPHEGELAAMERAFGLSGAGAKWQRAQALAQASGLVILAKGPDSLIAAPDGRLLCAARAPSWLSVAGSGDVLAGCVAARLAAGEDAFAAAATALWLHGEAARLAGGPFTAGQLAGMVRAAYRTAL
ncbi:MAG TPA: NAD(P)H-hydrate dehydratase, partial [Novosphingobium sp.]|nr:NAD(P)H-hydrate dehydratase [Novosphingobium sp.]